MYYHFPCIICSVLTGKLIAAIAQSSLNSLHRGNQLYKHNGQGFNTIFHSFHCECVILNFFVEQCNRMSMNKEKALRINCLIFKLITLFGWFGLMVTQYGQCVTKFSQWVVVIEKWRQALGEYIDFVIL